MALLELLIVLLAGEERVEALHLRALDVFEAFERGDDLIEGDILFRLAGKGRARGDEEVGVLRHDDVLVIEVEREVEALADGVAARQAGDGLVGNGLEDGGGDILRARALVQQRLDVGLGEDAAAAGDGVDLRGPLGELVQAGGVRV